ncbi:MAG: tripartite tricarboxylate transporter substrate binding protein [Betaproteobacteria bacterium]|nr:tripartite tricarboxylate transporter substrate binding protein [Betaproteobacteria bacterium]MDH3413632.1 tripartite tricarboxylate transporter substrate binding protein [Gammaproteobacteria bacterium]
MRNMVLNGTRVCCAVIIAAFTADALAQASYPTRAIRVIVPSSPGGGTDIVTRQLTPGLSQVLGRQVVVDNRPGAGTMIGIDLAAKSPPDGYTLLMGLATLGTLPATYKKLPYDTLKDLAPITQAVATPFILAVHPSLPVKSVKELIAFARKRPGEINYASAGQGTTLHFTMELFLTMTGLKMVHVPYKGSGPAITNLVAGHVTVATLTLLSGLPHVRSGRLRGLGITGAQRSRALPQLPTVAEAGVPGYESVLWYGLLAPGGTPRPIIERLHGAMRDVLYSPEVKRRFDADGAKILANTPEEFKRALEADLVKWEKVARAAGIRKR